MNTYDFCPDFAQWVGEDRLVVSYNKERGHVTCFFKGILANLGNGKIDAIFGRASNREEALLRLADRVVTAKDLGVLEIH